MAVDSFAHVCLRRGGRFHTRAQVSIRHRSSFLRAAFYHLYSGPPPAEEWPEFVPSGCHPVVADTAGVRAVRRYYLDLAGRYRRLYFPDYVPAEDLAGEVPTFDPRLVAEALEDVDLVLAIMEHLDGLAEAVLVYWTE